VVPEADDAESLRAERDALRQQVQALKSEKRKERRSRPRIATIFVILASLMLVVSTFAFWANRNFLRTDVWVERVAPLASDPSIQRSISNQMTDELMRVINPEQLFAQALPEKGKILAVPLAGAVHDFVQKETLKLVQTKQFQNLWVELNRRAHEQAVDTLKGKSKIVTAKSNFITVNFIPLIDQVLADLTKQSPDLFGHQVNIPKITYADIPADAQKKIADALGVQLPKNFGIVKIYDNGALRDAQDGLKIFNKVLVGSAILLVILTAAAFIITNRYRRTALQLLFGFSVALILVRRVVLHLDSLATAQIKNAQDKTSVKNIIHAFIDPLLANTEKVLIVFGIIAAVLVLTGSYVWVVSLRRWVASTARQAFVAAERQATDETTTRWIATYHQPLEIGVAVVFLWALWDLSFSWLGLLLWAVLFGGLELLIRRIADNNKINLAVAESTGPSAKMSTSEQTKTTTGT
jgi:hypothetical protein